MPYDWREMVFKEIIALDPEDPYYFTKRFSKAKLLLSADQFEDLKVRLASLLESLGLRGHKLRYLECKLQGKAGLKLRSATSMRKLSTYKVISSLAELDNDLDVQIKLLAPSIRWSGSLDLTPRTPPRRVKS